MIQAHEQVDDNGAEYLGFARQKLAWMDKARREEGSPAMSWGPCPVDSVEIYILASDTLNLIRIESATGGFICHPRDNTNKGGAKPGGVTITPEYTYPLVDDDHGSRVLTNEGEGWVVSSDVENYGNLDWQGPDGEVVSWRGPSGRQLQMDKKLSFPGFTVFDYSDSLYDYYTPYLNLIYRGGAVAYEFPWGYKVLGAALKGDTLVSIVGVDYDGRTNPDEGTGGFYNEVWLGAERIGFHSGSRPTVPWFFNSTGTEAVSGDQKVTIAGDNACTFSDISSGSGSQTNITEYATGENSSHWGFSRTGNWSKHRDYLATVLQGVEVNLAESQHSTMFNTAETVDEDIPIMIQGIPPTRLVVYGTETPAVGSTYTYKLFNSDDSEFTLCPDAELIWEFSNGTINSAGTITSITTDCGSATVSATLEGGGLNLTDSKSVRMANGYWKSLGVYTAPDYVGGHNYSFHECIIGSRKYGESIEGKTSSVYGNRNCNSYYLGGDGNYHLLKYCVPTWTIVADGGWIWGDERIPFCMEAITGSTEQECPITHLTNCGPNPITYFYAVVMRRTTYEWTCA